jgi:hypothetical protein
MRRLALVLAMAAGLALPSLAPAASTLPGKYTTKIATPAQFKGTWTLSFTKTGAYTVALNGAVMISGKYTVNGAKVALGHETGTAACKPAATYSYKRTGTMLKFTKVKDSATVCAGRVMVLAHVFTLKG